MNTDSPPINKFYLPALVRTVAGTPSQPWTDRALDEAATTDPVQLIHVFTIARTTAIKHVAAVHPDRCALNPTRPEPGPCPLRAGARRFRPGRRTRR